MLSRGVKGDTPEPHFLYYSTILIKVGINKVFSHNLLSVAVNFHGGTEMRRDLLRMRTFFPLAHARRNKDNWMTLKLLRILLAKMNDLSSFTLS